MASTWLLAVCVPTPPPPPPASVLLELNQHDRGYTLFLVHKDGSIVHVNARMRSIRPLQAPLGGALPAQMPVFSVTRDRVYFLDGDTDVRWVDSLGNLSPGVVLHVPGSAFVESGIAVTPDDSRVAVTTIGYTPNPRFTPPASALPATLDLSEETFAPNSGHVTILTATATPATATTPFLWAVGWRGGYPVVAIGEAGTNATFLDPYGTATGYYLVNASGNPFRAMQCDPAGPLSPAGTACLGPFSTFSWQGTTTPYPSSTPPLPVGAAISPNGQYVAYCCTSGDLMLWQLLYKLTSRPLGPTPGPTEGWIDDGHVVTEGVPGQPAKVYDIATVTSITTQAVGQVVGRLPGAM
jgi:hypothetical protein